jgi:hypothetical protein
MSIMSKTSKLHITSTDIILTNNNWKIVKSVLRGHLWDKERVVF